MTNGSVNCTLVQWLDTNGLELSVNGEWLWLSEKCSLSLVDEATEIISSCVERRVGGVASILLWGISRQIRSEWRKGYGVDQLLQH